MNNYAKLAIKRDRLNRLSNNPKNIKAPGVVRKLQREVRNLEKFYEKKILINSRASRIVVDLQILK